MSNVVSLNTKEPVKIDSIDDHIAKIQSAQREHPGVCKAITILIDDTGVMWTLHPIYSNTTNGDLFMALELIKHRMINGVYEL